MTIRAHVARLIGMTVFARLPARAPSDRILASLFHRIAAILYLVYFAWGIVATIDVIPTIHGYLGPLGEDVFTLAVAAFSLAGFIGATFFPLTGRTEMYAAALLSVLIGYYIVLIGASALEGLGGRWPAAVYGLAHLIVPIGRTAFVYLTLVRSSGEAR